jgi:hypothetical protein
MSNILAAFGRLDFLVVLWLFPIAYAIHEAEEWNIVAWERRHFTGLQHATDRGARTWLVFIALASFLWCAAATLPRNPTIAALVYVPAMAIALQNAVQHVYWLFRFREYAPGVISSILLLIPIGLYLVVRAVVQDLVPSWYVVVWAVLMVPGLIQTVRAGNVMSPQIQAIHRFGNMLAGWIGKG